MPYNQHASIQKSLAIFLVVLLFFVQGTKLLHRHDNTPVKTGWHQLAKTPHHCLICDYQLAKDAELPDTDIPSLKLSCEHITQPVLVLSLHPGVPGVQANKGPPAVMI